MAGERLYFGFIRSEQLVIFPKTLKGETIPLSWQTERAPVSFLKEVQWWEGEGGGGCCNSFSAVSSSQNQSEESGSWNKYQLEWHHYILSNYPFANGSLLFYLRSPLFWHFQRKIFRAWQYCWFKKKNFKSWNSCFSGKNCIFGKILRMEYIFTFENWTTLAPTTGFLIYPLVV